MSTRTKSTVLNIYGSIIYQLISAVSNIVVRKIFLIYFSADYLGLDGLFSNLINMLTLVDFGVGASCVYFIIRALAGNDEKELSLYYNFYSRIYKIVGIIIVIIGIILSFNLGLFIDDSSMVFYGDHFIRMVFILTFLRSISFYFFSCPKTTLLYAQKNYINMLINIVVTIIYTVVKMVTLIAFHNYYLYLIVLLLETLTNYAIGYIIFKKYFPNLKVHRSEANKVASNVFGYSKKIAFNGISLFLFNSTDNIIISKFLGLSIVGIMSNYYMIVNMITLVANQLFEAATASITNYINDKKNDNVERLEELMNNLNFIAFAISCFCVTCLFSLTDSFIGLMYGWGLVLDRSIIIAMVINVIICIFQNPLSTYSNGKGLLADEVKYTMIMAVVNIILSIALSQYIGVLGVLIGTIISNMILLAGRFFVVFNGLKMDKKVYIKKVGLYFIIVLFNIVLLSLLFTDNAANFGGFIMRGIASVVIVGIEILLFGKTKEFNAMFGFIKSFIRVGR